MNQLNKNRKCVSNANSFGDPPPTRTCVPNASSKPPHHVVTSRRRKANHHPLPPSLKRKRKNKRPSKARKALARAYSRIKDAASSVGRK